jgi:hypothetical protein
MKKPNRLSGMLQPLVTIHKTGEGKAGFEYWVRSPLAEPARGVASKDQRTRRVAVGRLVEIASDRKSRLEAMEAIRELGRAAREHEDEISTSFIERLGVETYSEAIKATAGANRALFGAFVAGAAGAFAGGILADSIPLGMFSFSMLGVAFYKLLGDKPVLNILKMTRSSAWRILERHELSTGVKE